MMLHLCLHMALITCLKVIYTGESKKKKEEGKNNKNTIMGYNYVIFKVSFPIW